MLQMENMVGEVVRGTLMETDRTVGGRKAVGGKVLSSRAAKYAAKMPSPSGWLNLHCVSVLIILLVV